MYVYGFVRLVAVEVRGIIHYSPIFSSDSRQVLILIA